MLQAVYEAAYDARAAALEHVGDVDAGYEGEDVDPRLLGASEKVLDTIQGNLTAGSYQFELMEEAVAR